MQNNPIALMYFFFKTETGLTGVKQAIAWVLVALEIIPGPDIAQTHLLVPEEKAASTVFFQLFPMTMAFKQKPRW